MSLRLNPLDVAILRDMGICSANPRTLHLEASLANALEALEESRNIADKAIRDASGFEDKAAYWKRVSLWAWGCTMALVTLGTWGIFMFLAAMGR